MKKMLSCIVLLIVLFSCKSGLPGSPKSTVASFIDACKEGNIDEVKKYITKSDAGLIALGEGFLAKLDSNGAKGMKEKMGKEFKEKTKEAKIDIKDEKIDGDNATVNVEFTQNGKAETHPFKLVKEDEQWKVSLLSTGMNNTGSNHQDVDMEEAMKNMNMDSLQGHINEGMKEFNKINKDSLRKVIEDGMKDVEKLKDIPKKDE